VAVAVAMLVAAILPACARAGRPAAGRTVDIVERDFHISGPSSIASGGAIDLHIHNNGPSTHELVIVRTDLAAPNLPLQLDGLTIDEESPLLHAVDEDADIPLGTTADLVLHLTPGHYVLFCNLEGHYLGGMHLSLEVGDGTGN
jgi:uncharacterized cupredoxin-like copper-binding protein